MQFPIVEIRESNLFVLADFKGEVLNEEIKCPFNHLRNLTKYVIDSSGEVWEFSHKAHNHCGPRKVLSGIWNTSSDIYSYRKHMGKDVNWLRGVLKSYMSTENPDTNELAEALIDDLSAFEGNTVLSPTVMGKLNL